MLFQVQARLKEYELQVKLLEAQVNDTKDSLKFNGIGSEYC